MLTKLDYKNAIEEMVSYIKDAEFKHSIIAVYIGGSVSRGDFVPGRSDIDLYVVMSMIDKDVESNLIHKASQVANNLLTGLHRTCGECISVTFTTIKDIKEGRSWIGYGSAYFDFINSSKILYGMDIKSQIITPTVEEIKNTSSQAMDMLLSYIQSNNKPNLNEDNLNYILRGVFGGVFSAIHFLLSYNGIYVRGKREMKDIFVDTFKADVNEGKLVDLLYNEWCTYGARDLSVEEGYELIDNSLVLIENVNRMIKK